MGGAKAGPGGAPAPRGRRQFGMGGEVLLKAIAIAFSLFHLYTASFGAFGALQQRSVHLAFALTLTFLLCPPHRKVAARRGTLALDVVLAVSGAVASLYLFVGYLELPLRTGFPTRTDLVVGVVAVLLVLEATRRLMGWTLPLIAGWFLLYAYLGRYLPGPLAHAGADVDRIVSHLYLTTEGIFGFPLGVSATFVVLFVIFGAFLEESGGGRFFIDLANALFGRVRGGPAKVAVIGSSLFGTISGSAVANVVGTGTFTIPLMKRAGYPAHVVGAVEAIASTGGQLMPPIMGAAAFIMAEILGIPYLRVVAAAALPAVVYYASLFMYVDLEAAKLRLRGLPREELPRAGTVLKENWPLIVPVAVLVFSLAVLFYSPTKSAFWAIVATVLFSQLRRAGRMSFLGVLRALEKGGKGVLEVALACACAGIVVGVFTLTGLGMRLSSAVVHYSGGSLLALLLLTMVSSLLLGMGMPTTACYVILAVTVAPSLVEAGVSPLAAHLFVFYFGMLSAITPPVAVAAFAAAGIAGASTARTGLTAVRLGLAAFAIPYMFVYGPGLLLQGSFADVALVAVSSLVGVLALAAAVAGFLARSMTAAERCVLLVGGVALMKPGYVTDLVGYGLVGLFAFLHCARRRPRSQPLPERSAESALTDRSS